LSNVEYEITVTDTETGENRQYFNPSGHFASVGAPEALLVNCGDSTSLNY